MSDRAERDDDGEFLSRIRVEQAIFAEFPIATQNADGTWSWNRCPDCGAKDAHHGCGIRCG